MTAALHRIEALAGNGRYALTFRRPDGGEQGVVVEVAGDALSVAAASLPAGAEHESAAFGAATRAVLALHEARSLSGGAGALRDVDGGWDVGLGNVVLGADGVPQCTAHGPMERTDGMWVCAECGARAVLD